MSRLHFREEVHEWSDSEEEDEALPQKGTAAPAAIEWEDVPEEPQEAQSRGRITEDKGRLATGLAAVQADSAEEDEELPSRKKRKRIRKSMQREEQNPEQKEAQARQVEEDARPSQSSQGLQPADAVEHAGEGTAAKAAKPVQVSSYLQRFLAVKRTKADVPLPEIVPLNDEVIRNFAEEFKKFGPPTQSNEQASDHDDSSSSSEDEAEQPTGRQKRAAARKAASKGYAEGDSEEEASEQDSSESDSSYEDEEDEEGDTTIHTSHGVGTAGPHLFLSNLPYAITEAELTLELAILGVVSSEVKLHTDKATGRNAGTAEVTLDQGVTTKEALTKLQGKAIGKRTVFAAAYKPKPSRPSTGSSRYYHQNIHVKCVRCGEVGHAASSCSNPPLPTPCYLCGGTDHMDWECRNIVCFNCGGFGHHSRQCKKAPSSRARVCTRCGSTRHDKTRCDVMGAPLEHDTKFARCVVCGEYGHLACGEEPSKLRSEGSAEVYCWNCGEPGHTPDYVGVQGGCTAPKPDGFVRYPDFTRAYYSGAGRGYLRDLLRQMRRENPNLFYSDGDAGSGGDRRHSDGYHRDRGGHAGDQRARKSYGGTERAGGDEFEGGDRKKRKRHGASGRAESVDDSRQRRPHSFGGYNTEDLVFHPGTSHSTKSRKSEGRVVSRVEHGGKSRKNSKR